MAHTLPGRRGDPRQAYLCGQPAQPGFRLSDRRVVNIKDINKYTDVKDDYVKQSY